MSRPLAQAISEIEKRLRSAGRLSLFLDFDGTLVPLGPDPSAIRLDPATRETLKRISRKESIAATVISGRAIDDLYMRVGHVEGIVYAGNHGLQIFGRGMYFVEPTAAARSSELCRMSSALVEKLKPFMGAFVEFKGLTTAIHFRITPEENVQQISTVVRDTIATNPECFQLKSGSKVLEIVPRTNWNKGAAVRWINRRLGDGEILSIYIGDDNTDEDAFRELPDSITVKVGDPAGTLARYQAPDPDAVHDFLLRLTDCELSRSAGH